MTPDDIIERLASHATLAGVPRSELEWLAAHGTVRDYAEGAVLTRAGGAPPDGLFIIFDGHIVIYVNRGAGPKKVMEWRGGDVTGMLPYSRMATPPGDTVTVERTIVLAIASEKIREMIRECHAVTGVLVHKMLDRARQFASSDLHDEKMASLGRLSAGLAHELNNPAAAIERSAALLEDRLEDAERATLALGAARLSEQQLSAIETVRASCLATRIQGVLSPIQQVEREDAISDWLADHGLDEDIAGQLVETAVTIDALDAIAREVSGPCLDATLRWAASGCSVRALASEIQDAAMRISGLVAAVKGFTHMDQGSSAEPVDLARNLSNTVAVLRSKAREKSIAVALTIDPDLPAAVGFVGELNQIFSNLIDNALDAVPEGGHIEVTASRDKQRVVVRVIDDGPGIPPDVKARMFDPFFTTKPVGKGTGLGLDIVRRLLGHNNAQIEVDSLPGRTEFRVLLPSVDEVGGQP
jgi:signal transduction histidine kinase